jgi:uncharacterized metal-binding protein YceD (DUF177 family)
LVGAPTYDTRPMPDDGSKLSKVALLADEAAHVLLEVPVAALDRLLPLLASHDGMVKGDIAFSRERNWVLADIVFSVRLDVQCQRCLERFSLPLSGESRVAVVSAPGEVDAVPPEWETTLAPDGSLKLRELLEEEVLLAMPAAPRHEDGQCRDARAQPQAAPHKAPVQRPFAGLDGLLKSDRLQK